MAIGSPEVIVFGHVPSSGGILSDDLDELAGAFAKVGLSKAIQSKWLQVVKEPLSEAEAAAAAAAEAAGQKKDKKDAAKKRVLRCVESVVDEVQAQLQALQAGTPPSEADLAVLKKRGLATVATFKSLRVKAGPQVSHTPREAPSRSRALGGARVRRRPAHTRPSLALSSATGGGRRRLT